MGAFLDVFGGGSDIRPLDEPGCCCICEANPDQSQTKIINTNRFFRPQRFTDLKGRKYVCGDCASDLGKAIGQVDGDEHDALESTLSATKEELAATKETVSSYAALDAAIQTLAPQVAVIEEKDTPEKTD